MSEITKSDWISVRDRLPDNSIKKLLVLDQKSGSDHYKSGYVVKREHETWEQELACGGTSFTHWFLIPQDAPPLPSLTAIEKAELERHHKITEYMASVKQEIPLYQNFDTTTVRQHVEKAFSAGYTAALTAKDKI